MSLHRQNPKRDTNEREIIAGLEAYGVLVWQLSAAGLPDLLTYRQGRWLPLEIKRHRPRRRLSDRKGRGLTPSQCVTYSLTQFPIVETVDEALKAVGVKT